MARIIFSDSTGHYDGRDLERSPLGGTETSVIRCAEQLALRGHDVTVFTNCDGLVRFNLVTWRPLSSAQAEICDLYVAIQHASLLGLGRRAARKAIWVLWPSNQLKHYKKIWQMWLHRPVPVLISLDQVKRYSPFLPKRDPHIVVPHGLPDDVRGHPIQPVAPPPRAIFASNPQRNLRRLVELWATSILPRAQNAILDVYGVTQLKAGDDAWTLWEGTLLPPGLSLEVKKSVRIHASVDRASLISAMRGARAMLYLGHKAEAFCLAVAEAQALGVPAVVAPIAVLPERVIDGVTGFVRADGDAFADAAVALLTDERLWRRQHEAAIRCQQGISWSEHAGRFENALLADRIPIYRSVLDPGTALNPD